MNSDLNDNDRMSSGLVSSLMECFGDHGPPKRLLSSSSKHLCKEEERLVEHLLGQRWPEVHGSTWDQVLVMRSMALASKEALLYFWPSLLLTVAKGTSRLAPEFV